MQKITPENALEIARRTGKRTYYVNPFWLSQDGYFVERNGELLLGYYDQQDEEIYFVYPPDKKENFVLNGCWVTPEQLEDLTSKGFTITDQFPLGPEYYYRTKDFIEMKGGHFHSFRKQVNYFTKTYKYRILHDYPADKILAFLDAWASTKDLATYSDYSREIFLWDLNDCKKYVALLGKIPSKNIFVEVDGTLAGFAITSPIFPDFFVAVAQKAKNEFRGLSRFLYHEKCKLHPDTELFSVGTAASTPGLESFKNDMHPAKKIELIQIEVSKRKI